MTSLAAFLASLRAGGKVVRIAILGVGNELNGDDAAGVLVARKLKETWGERAVSGPFSFLVIEAAAAPENFTGSLRRFRPDLVLWIDAAGMSAEPGAVDFFAWQQMDGISAATHILPPSVLARYLAEELGCRVALVGIQPAHLDFDRPVSTPVLAAVDRLVEDFRTLGDT